MPQIVPKSVQTCFEHVLGRLFPKNFLPSVSLSLETSKILKKSDRAKLLRLIPKCHVKKLNEKLHLENMKKVF